jgi:hypothetical protein
MLTKNLHIHIGKIVDKGVLSSVSECTLNGKKHIIKIEHITKKEQNDKNSDVWNEINFSFNFGNKYPEHFMSLMHYSFEENCKNINLLWKNGQPLGMWSDKLISEYKKRIDEHICIYKIYTRMDTILNKILNKLSRLQLYSMLIQVSYAMRLLHTHDYIHGDLHIANVGVMKTGLNTKIKLGKNKIPTYGYQYKLIDFGLTLHKNNALTVYDKKRFFNETNHTYDDGLFCSLCQFILTDGDDYYKKIKKLKKTQEFLVINEINSTNTTIQEYLYMTLFPDKYISIFSGKIFSGALLPIPDLIFFAKYGMHSNESYYYLLSKINN